MVINIYSNCCIAATGLDEILEGSGALGVLSAAAEGDAEGREDGALSASVLAGDEIDVLVELDV